MSEVNYTQCEKKGSKYINKWGPWPHGYVSGLWKLIKWVWSMTYRKPLENLDENLPIYKPNFTGLKEYENDSKIIVTWFGHASILLEMEGFKILCDPLFSERCGPVGGPRRYRAPPCKVEDLPNIDVVVISHNHYDHMDAETIKTLSELNKEITWFIPDGDKDNLLSMINDKKEIHEMKWWEERELEKQGRKLKFAFTPTQHWSNRGLLDAFKSLWGSWAFIGEKSKFWFGGDTGYCGAFKEIGSKYGPFDGAAIPIGAYEPRDLLQFQHCNPEEAVKIHKDIKSNVSFGIHWGTFVLSEENYMGPKIELEKCVSEKDKFITINHGATLVIYDDDYKIVLPPHQQNKT